MIKYLLILLICIPSYSQQIILSSGENEYSVGQVFYEYNNGGIQIPKEVYVLNIIENIISNIIIYPNPTKHNIIINIGDDSYLNYKLFDMNGKLIKKDIIRNTQSICMENLPKGIYILKLNKEIFKILKL